MANISDFLKSERAAKERDPVQYEKERKEDARKTYKDSDRYQNEKLMERYDRLQKSKGSGRASSMDLEGGMKPGQSPSLDNPIKMAKGGMTASKRADGCCVKGKTKGRMV
jgi:hypothetical protein